MISRRAGAGLSAALLLAGCTSTSRPTATSPVPTRPVHNRQPAHAPPFRHLIWHDAGPAALRRARPPRSTAITGAFDLFAAGGDVVFAATHHGISRSLDGGRDWSAVLRGPAMGSVTRGPTGYVALGTRNDGRVVTATTESGVGWRTVVARPRRDGSGPFLGAAVVMTGGVGVAVDRPDRTAWGDAPMWRTTDGGRHWDTVKGLVATGGLAMSASATIVATGQGRGRWCRGAVFVSVDLGARWSELPGSCRSLPLTGVQFLDGRHAVAVGGVESKLGGGRIIETTADGGRSWTTTRYDPPHPSGRSAPDAFAGINFLTPTTGFVYDGVCADSQNGPCPGGLEWTTDSGRLLRPIADPAESGWLSVAVTGPDRYVAAATSAGDDEVVGTTLDGGARWRLEAPPRALAGESGFDGVIGTPHRLFWGNALGGFISRDDGRHWRRLEAPRRTRRQVRAAAGRRMTGRAEQWRLRGPVAKHSWVLHSLDGGRRWTAYQLPSWVANWGCRVVPTGPDAAVFSRRGALWRTRDGGATWRQHWPRLAGEGRR